MMKIAKKLTATLLALSLLVTLCITASAATKDIGNYAYIGDEAKAQTLTYAYDELKGKKFDGSDYDYGSFEEKKAALEIENPLAKFGLKALLGWKAASGADGVTVQTVTDSHSGNYAMQFTNTDTAAASTLLLYPALGDKATDEYSGDITGLAPYGNYQFVFWYKGSESKTLKVHYYTNVNNAATEIVTPYTCADTWQQASINIMADSTGTIKLWLDFGEEVSSGQYVLIDDVSLYRCGVGADGSINLFGDDGLESTVAGDFQLATTSGKWMYIKDSAGNYTHFARTQDATGDTFTMGVSDTEAHNGEKSLKIVSAASANNYIIKLRPQYVYYNWSSAKTGYFPAQNGYYTLSFWIKGDPNVYGLNVYAGDSSATEYKFSNFKSDMENISANAWHQVAIRNIPVTDGDIYADISIILYGTNQGATEVTPLYIDDIQLVRQSNYVENGDFENQEIGAVTSVEGFAFDSTFANNTVEITDNSISGGKALKITQNANGAASYGGTFYADGILASESAVEDAPAGDYLVSVWSKGNDKPYFQYGPDTGCRDRIGATGNVWALSVKSISVTDTVTANAKLSFLQSADYIGATLYLDDLRIETADDALARVKALLQNFDVDTATANEIEYLRQWVNYFKDKLDIAEVNAFRISIGDVTNNGAFDANDMGNIRGYLLGTVTGADTDYDVNGDTAADIRDLVRAVSIPRV